MRKGLFYATIVIFYASLPDNSIICPPQKRPIMLEDYENKKRKQVTFMRSVLDYGMGVVFILLGVLIFMREKISLGEGEAYKLNVPNKLLGGVFALYGLWRVYKGYKKNYFNE
jgi:hypothetical protein